MIEIVRTVWTNCTAAAFKTGTTGNASITAKLQSNSEGVKDEKDSSVSRETFCTRHKKVW